MVTVQKGAVKFKSLMAAYEAAKKKNPELKYITVYMRMRAAEKKGGLGWNVSQAYHKPVRRYARKVEMVQQEIVA